MPPIGGSSRGSANCFRGWTASAAFAIRPVILPAPVLVWRELVGMAQSGSLADDLLTSLWELLCGFLLGSVLGLLTGVALARHAQIRAFLDPIVEGFRFIAFRSRWCPW